jgi:hypothetical protein
MSRERKTSFSEQVRLHRVRLYPDSINPIRFTMTGDSAHCRGPDKRRLAGGAWDHGTRPRPCTATHPATLRMTGSSCTDLRPPRCTLPSRWRPRRPRGANQEPRSPQDSSHTGQKAASALRYAVTGQRPSAAPLVVCWSGANTAWGTALAPFRRICPCVCHQTAPPPCDVKRHSA